MSNTILVAPDREQNIAALLRRLERVTEPGDRLVFLIEYQMDLPSCLLAHVALLQAGVERGIVWEERRARLTWDEQKTWAEKNIAQQARRAFEATGVHIEVDLYCGSLHQVVKRYLYNDEVTLIYRGSPPRLGRIHSFPGSIKSWFGLRRHHPSIRLTDGEVPVDQDLTGSP